jgi:hypothetical protein
MRISDICQGFISCDSDHFRLERVNVLAVSKLVTLYQAGPYTRKIAKQTLKLHSGIIEVQ